MKQAGIKCTANAKYALIWLDFVPLSTYWIEVFIFTSTLDDMVYC